MSITATGIDETISLINKYGSSPTEQSGKIQLFLLRLAQIGINRAQFIYSRSTSDIPLLSAIQINENTICVKASGKNVLFLEFGTGITYMADYPGDEDFHPIYRAGDWSTSPRGKGHWDDPRGWWYPIGPKQWQHTMGNPPLMAMYEAKKEMQLKVNEIIREVFG